MARYDNCNGSCFSNIVLSVYKGASKEHVITNVAGGKTITIKKKNFPDTGNLLAQTIVINNLLISVCSCLESMGGKG